MRSARPSISGSMNMRPFVYPYCRTLRAAVMAILLSIASSSISAGITDEELIRFVQGYLDAAQQPTPDAEVNHYAKQVRYFDSGTVDQDFVAADQRRYYKLW